MENDKKERDKKEKEKAEYEEGLKKTLIPLLFGVLAGVISYALCSSGFLTPASEDGLLIAILMVLVQKFAYPFLHTSIKGAKDWIYIGFMTVFCWFISFTLLLNNIHI